MFSSDEVKLDKKLKEIKYQKELWDKKQEIKDIKKSMRSFHFPTTTKLIMFFIFANCTIVELYSMIVMVVMMDLSSLYSLITAVITESISFAIYACKAYNETKQEQLMDLERDKLEYEFDDETLGEDSLNDAG